MKQRYRLKNDTNYKKFSDSEGEEEETELQVRQKSPRKETPTVDKLIEEGDTLQSLAIRYCCSIEDIKRLNNIHKENEIFARRTIKVPHYPISMALAGVHVSGRNSPSEASSSKQDLNVEIKETLLNLETIAKESEVNAIIFNSNLSKIDHPVSTEIEEDVDEEQTHLLPQHDVVETSILSFNGVDGDISLKALIVCIVILIFAVPLIYVLYIAEHPEQYHHDNHHHVS